jgi:prophage regulatory protein
MSGGQSHHHQPFAGRRLLTLREVMDLTGVGRSTIYNWVQRGLFPAPHRAGYRTARWLEEEVEAWRAALPIATEDNWK